jgi:hypothetical protein
MSSFLGDLLGSEGCNPDGSIGQNPFTALVEKSFEYLHQNDPNQESFHSMGEHMHHQDESFRLMNNEPQQHQMMQVGFDLISLGLQAFVYILIAFSPATKFFLKWLSSTSAYAISSISNVSTTAILISATNIPSSIYSGTRTISGAVSRART